MYNYTRFLPLSIFFFTTKRWETPIKHIVSLWGSRHQSGTADLKMSKTK